MTTASPSRSALRLESLLEEDSDQYGDSLSPAAPKPGSSSSSRLDSVLSSLNGLETRTFAKLENTKRLPDEARPFAPPVQAPEWGLDDDLEMEEELERERETQWGAEAPWTEEAADDGNDHDHEAGSLAVPGPSSRTVPSAPSQGLQLEDSGLLGDIDVDGQSPRLHQSAIMSLQAPVTSASTSAQGLAQATASIASSSTHTATQRWETAIPKYIPAGHFNALSMDGHVVRLERRRRLKGWKPPPPRYGDSQSTGLLSQPVHRIIDSIRAKEAEEIVLADEEAAARAARLNESSSKPRKREDGKVWVEKYRPKRFAELLGDERVHREVMGWLREWDACVFRRKTKKRTKEAAPALNAYGQPIVEQRDPFDRPPQRVLLISGAPGLGKTTLAHVLAKAAGYGVYELNASDARTSGAVTDTIKMALESASLKDVRPTCLVVDEIDGATGGGAASGGGGEEGRGFIKALVDLVENGAGVKGKKGRKGKRSKPLLRPIICICNDLYAPALRPLRPHCRLIRFQKPAQNHLVGRLKTVCEAESVSASSRCLSLLAELAQGDIRACLNALQMAKHRAMRGAHRSSGPVEVTEADVREAGVGVKDGSTSTQNVWRALFKTPSPKERARKTAPSEGSALTHHLVNLVQSCGEHNRVLQGCFEHYPALSFVDDGWWRIRSVLGWVDWGLDLQDKAFGGGMFDLMGYVPWSFVKWHTLFANTVNALPEWPKVDYEHRLKRTAFDEISLDLVAALPPTLRCQFQREHVVTELGPTLMRMLTPDLKPVNAQMVKTADRQTMEQLVRIMLHFGLEFVQDKTEEGHLIYRLEPPLEVFTSYEGKRSASVNQGRYAVRQMAMKELDAERRRRKKTLGGIEGIDGERPPSALDSYRKKPSAAGSAGGASAAKAKVALDFFGRPIVSPTVKKAAGGAGVGLKASSTLPAPLLAARQAKEAAEAEATAGGEQSSTSDAGGRPPAAKRLKVHYRHNEGYSNAVRQPVKMSALL
ncbi:unnamed protein product [Jaminaea pallidilutea]